MSLLSLDATKDPSQSTTPLRTETSTPAWYTDPELVRQRRERSHPAREAQALLMAAWRSGGQLEGQFISEPQSPFTNIANLLRL
jgi:hypothetical protein